VRESLRTRLFRWAFNVWPCFRGTGARVAFIASDWSEVRVRLPLSWRTRNYVGTIFGGSLYAGVDPFYMLMLIHRLGPEYVVWDKAAAIRFRKPGRGTLFATFRVDEAEVAEIRRLLQDQPKVDRDYAVEWRDAEGVIHVELQKVIHISHRKPS
jgi:acyl-coenzyme A thioesterase PaaI-like protein